MTEINTVLVTGATGFLGAHILAALRDRGITTIAACRSPEKLPDWFDGAVRQGDLTDPGYRKSLVEGVNTICHAGTWGAFWGHEDEERRLFLEPTMDLIDLAAEAGVGRFLLASTLVVGQLPGKGGEVDDFSPMRKTGFWPHLDMLIDIDHHMRALASAVSGMVNMRLGHFIGPGNRVGFVPAVIPRLKTRLVPWLGNGKARMALVTGEDMGQAFALAATTPGLAPYESFNIHSGALPSLREVFSHIAAVAGVPKPLYAVPYWAGYLFGALMEALPTRTPFLTRSLVHVSEDWNTPIEHARSALGYRPSGDWRQAITRAVEERRKTGFAWPALTQALA